MTYLYKKNTCNGMSTVGCTFGVDLAYVMFPPLSRFALITVYFCSRLFKSWSVPFPGTKMSSRRSAFHLNVDVVWQYHAFKRRPNSHKVRGVLVSLQILHAACIDHSMYVSTVTPCAQWCINV